MTPFSPPTAAVPLRAKMEPQPGEYGVKPFFRGRTGRIESWKLGPIAFPTMRGGPIVTSPFGLVGSVWQGLEILTTGVQKTDGVYFWVATGKPIESERAS
jgi:hypothetical protein